MCTIAAAWQALDDAPVAIAANRDEALDRPSHPPRTLDSEPAVVAPQDAEAGGTWIGVNEFGTVVAITNRRVDLVGERSRGLLVRDALRAESGGEAAAVVRSAVRERRYAGFNLLVVDPEDATYFEWDGALRERALDPGVHVIVNDGIDDAVETAARLRDDLSTAGRSAEEWFDRAAALLSDHDYGVCVHGDGYGTRSSSLLRVDADGAAAYSFADGPPCRSSYEPVAAPILEGQV